MSGNAAVVADSLTFISRKNLFFLDFWAENFSSNGVKPKMNSVAFDKFKKIHAILEWIIRILSGIEQIQNI